LAFVALLPATAEAEELKVLDGDLSASEGTLTLRHVTKGSTAKSAGRSQSVYYTFTNKDSALVRAIQPAASEGKYLSRATVSVIKMSGFTLLPDWGFRYSASLLAVDGYVTAPTHVLAAPDPGADQGRALEAATEVELTDARVAGGRTFFKIGEQASEWLPSELVRIGTAGMGGSLAGDLASLFGGDNKGDGLDGRVFEGTVRALATSGPYAAPARKLEGQALARIGMTHYKRGVTTDLPTIGLRFVPGHGKLGTAPEAGDQDLELVAGAERTRDLLLPGLLRVNKLDYFANAYHGTASFRLVGTERNVWVRLVPAAPIPGTPTTAAERETMLDRAVSTGKAVFRVELQMDRSGLQGDLDGVLDAVGKGPPWTPFVEITFAPAPSGLEGFQLETAMGPVLEPLGGLAEYRFRASSPPSLPDEGPSVPPPAPTQAAPTPAAPTSGFTGSVEPRGAPPGNQDEANERVRRVLGSLKLPAPPKEP
jgi:hypothetical protein